MKDSRTRFVTDDGRDVPAVTTAESQLWLADIGVPREVYRRVGIEYAPPFSGRSRVRLHVDSPDGSREEV